MILLLSGEGSTDLGRSNIESPCYRDNFQPGPMAHLVDQILESILNYAPLDYSSQPGCEPLLQFVPEKHLKNLQPRDPKKLRFNGRKDAQGTKFHFKFAEVLGRYALKIEAENSEAVLAVFFRDADRTNTTPATEWQEKWDSIIKGFKSAGFKRGVPMLPKPISEAWILCALKNNYVNCENLEDEPSNPKSPKHLKGQLAEVLNGNELEVTKIDADKIDMPSFNAFKNRLIEAAQNGD